MDSTLEIQKAVYAALAADSTLAALVSTRIYDKAPESVAYPCVSFGEPYGEPWAVQGWIGWRCIFEVSSFSRKPGHVEVGQCAAACSNVLHRQTLTLASQSFVLCDLQSQYGFEWQDGITHQITQRYEFLTHPPA